MSIKISAVICTHNRAAYLRKSLQSLVEQTIDQELYEIIVVDNDSQDETKQVVDRYSRIPNLRYLYEPVIGLSRARNKAWSNARGAYVAFLDDDAVACSGWLATFLDVFESFKPIPGAVGGKCEAIWEAPRPNWLSDKLLGYISILHWSDVPIVLDDWQGLSACNIAYPREVLEAAGGFREDLGRKGNTLRAGGETYLRHQLDSWGCDTVYHPDLVVGHHVSRSKLTKKWFRARAYWQGMSSAFMTTPDGYLSYPSRVRLTLQRFGWSLPRLFLMLVTLNPAGRFRRQCQVLESSGYVKGLWIRETSNSKT